MTNSNYIFLRMVNVEACFLGSAQEDESNVRKNLFQYVFFEQF